MKNFLGLVLVMSLVFLLGIPSTADVFAQTENENPLIGTWDVELTEMQMMMQFTFKMEEDVLTGSLEFDMGGSVMEDISFEDNKLTFNVSIDAGGQMMGIDVEAIIEENEITGTMFTEMGEAIFTGKKRENF